MKIKEKITEAAEKVYDLTRDGKYDVDVALFSKSNKAVTVNSKRKTSHTKKWRAKNR